MKHHNKFKLGSKSTAGPRFIEKQMGVVQPKCERKKKGVVGGGGIRGKSFIRMTK